MGRPRHAVSRRTLRLLTLALLGVVLAGGFAAAVSGPAVAEPTPSPAPGSGVPDPGTRPSPNPAPPGGSSPDPTPSPIGPPPADQPSPSPSTPSTPAPTPGPTPPGWSPPSNEDYGDPGLFDIPGQVRKAINDFFVWVVEGALDMVLSALGDTVLSTPDLTDDERVRTMWTTSLVVANALLVLFVLAGAFLVTSRETLQTRYGLKEVLPRLALAGVLVNANLLVLDKGIEATNAVTAAIAGQGVDGAAAADALGQALGEARTGNGFLLTLLMLGVLAMAIVVVFQFVFRVAAFAILIGLAPMALLCHASPVTEPVAFAWWRAAGVCLGIQIGQAVVLLGTLRMFLTPAGDTITGPGFLIGIPTPSRLISILVVVAVLWLLIKIPGWSRQFVLGPLGQGGGRGLIRTLIHAFLMVKTLGAASGLARGAGTAARAAGTAGRAGTTPRPGGGPRPRPGPCRPSPSPIGPAAFSHAPVTHTPLSSPAGTNAAPTFSHAPSPSPAGPSPSGGVPAAHFSHPSPAHTPRPAPGTPAARVAFSDAAPATPTRADARPAPGVTFSAATPPHSAPRRPPTPVTPVFSAAPVTPAGGPRRGASAASRPTAARRATPAGGGSGTAGARTPSAGTPRVTPRARRAAAPSPAARRTAAPSPPPSPAGRAPAVPSPRPSPAAGRAAPPSPSSPRAVRGSSPAPGPSPVVRAARPVSSPPPVPPSPPSRRRPQDRGDR